jgi:hypothetical protein
VGACNATAVFDSAGAGARLTVGEEGAANHASLVGRPETGHNQSTLGALLVRRELAAKAMFLLPNGFLLENEPLVIEHGKMPLPAASDPMAKQSEAVFHVLQKDLAGRSKHGQLREAKTSGHYIQRDQPALVTQSIRDVIRESAALDTAKLRS